MKILNGALKLGAPVTEVPDFSCLFRQEPTKTVVCDAGGVFAHLLACTQILM